MKNNNTPEIRFPGFTGEWEERKLGEIYTERKERGYDSLQIFSVSIHHGVSNEELDSNTLGKKVRRSEDKSLYKHVYFGDLVLNMMRAWQGAIGVVKSEGMVSPAYITAIPGAELYPLFMDYCLRRDETIIQMDNLSYGVTDFRKRLYWDSFINVVCRIPSVPEQERITDFFTHLDNLIILHQQELTTLKQTKQGFLQKMFPKEGESVPEVRFPGFTGEWEERVLGDNVEFYSGLTYSPDNIIENGTLVLRSSNIKSGEIVDADNVYVDPKIVNTQNVQIGDVIVVVRNGSRNLIGKHAIVKKNMDNTVIGAFMTGIRSKIPSFTNALLDSNQFAKEINKNLGATINQITTGEFKKMKFYFPSNDEQEKIGNFFKKIDDTIALHQRELDALKETKKAFLQKMFV
ncbi:restriction endonuclease subunit S [Bacillus haynesii]|uniref:restriction endonuclease subunit S n=1 Tax=Bacillus haynesii TaxID=1925021 RepID=UPI00227ECAAD|nr:restriction endonuclease subunit S [Bacillus haynesii]MCY8343392.1 restriction endonuclease subunit S [Bacillus haynesii]